jgi:hypothetical protein
MAGHVGDTFLKGAEIIAGKYWSLEGCMQRTFYLTADGMKVEWQK